MSSIFDTATKFREVSSDKIVYNLPGSSIEDPKQITVTSTLPTPRKGNPGTVITAFNIRRLVVLDAGTDSERKAPIVVKVQYSLPLGSTQVDREAAFADVVGLTEYTDAKLLGLVKNGVFPND
jgi:hypothetical protein